MHISPSNKKYIGITKNTPSWRWRNGSGYSRNVAFFRAIKKYGWDTFHHGIIAQGLTQEEAESMEVALIAFHRTCEPKYGYNISLGGHIGISNPSPEFKEKLRIANTGINNHKSTPVVCIETGDVYESVCIAAKKLNLKKGNILKVLRGRNKHTGGYTFGYLRKKDEKEKIKTHSRKELADMSKKAVAVYTNSGELVCTYPSRKEAAEACDTTLGAISSCINGRKKTANGFQFRDATNNDFAQSIMPNTGTSGANNNAARAVLCYTKEGILIKSYPYAKMAAMEHNADLSSIIKCCRGKVKTCRGYIWRYAEQNPDQLPSAWSLVE